MINFFKAIITVFFDSKKFLNLITGLFNISYKINTAIKFFFFFIEH
jgi:hypothetical protein